ncbi:MAG: long-chain-fatty-acid--CoA ligase [Deltaproteobacteria bacterium]|nr:long-chain-fatty-acid--CoA ligase [Deltaproteobacteria bacterium]
MDMTLDRLLTVTAGKYPEREAFVFEDARTTFSTFQERVNQRANCLLSLGVYKGEHVATLSKNAMGLVESIFAFWRIGAVPVPLNFRLSPGELTYMVIHSDATTILFSREYDEIARHFRENCDAVSRYLCMGRECPDDWLDFDGETTKASSESPGTRVNEEDMATILYTAGTTGRPKGVVATHRNWAWSTLNGCFSWGIEPEVRLTVYPLFHAASIVHILMSVATASTLVVLREFDARRVLELVETEKVNRLGNPPTVYNMLLQVPDIMRYDLSSVRHLASGAEIMPDETRRRLLSVFPGAGISENYGMTESCALLASRAEAQTERKPYSVGRPLHFVEIRIVDGEGRDAPPGEVGEVIARGPNIMKGYYKEAEKSAEALGGGWLHTQDMGKQDEDGFLYIVERQQHMIISGGENIYPKEVEDVLYRHPKIVETAVFGLPDRVWGEKVCAAVVLKKGERLSEEDIGDFCKRTLASFKKPKSVFFVDALPRSAVGKVLRTELKKKYGA